MPYFHPYADHADTPRSLLTFLALAKRLDRRDPRRAQAIVAFRAQAKKLGLL